MLLLHDSTRTGSPPAICQRRRRRGGAELSGKVRCHGEGCVVRERKRSKNLAQAPIPHVRPCRKCRLVVRLSGCQAVWQRKLDHQRHKLRHALHLLSALSGCRHASAIIAWPGIASRQAVTRACSVRLPTRVDDC